jgi:hypothetical protein
MTDRDRTTRTRARAPGVGGVFHRMAVHYRVLRPDTERTIVATTRCTKGGCKLDGGRRMPGAGLSRLSPRKAPFGKPASAVLRENLPYGMIGGIEEMSASFEARTAPRSYPTTSDSHYAPQHPRLERLPGGAFIHWKAPDCTSVARDFPKPPLALRGRSFRRPSAVGWVASPSDVSGRFPPGQRKFGVPRHRRHAPE